MTTNLEKGDIVILNSGSPHLVVGDINVFGRDGDIMVTYFYEGKLQNFVTAQECFTLIKKRGNQ